MPRLRLVTDEPELDPPAPLPIEAWRHAPDPEALDSIEAVERALTSAQRAMDALSEQAEALDDEPLPFPGRRDDDDGPWAA